MHKACRHAGHVPVKLRGSIERCQRLDALRKRLADAISAEDYEEAGALSREIEELSQDKGKKGDAAP